jgi:hypothetical protein
MSDYVVFDCSGSMNWKTSGSSNFEQVLSLVTAEETQGLLPRRFILVMFGSGHVTVMVDSTEYDFRNGVCVVRDCTREVFADIIESLISAELEMNTHTHLALDAVHGLLHGVPVADSDSDSEEEMKSDDDVSQPIGRATKILLITDGECDNLPKTLASFVSLAGTDINMLAVLRDPYDPENEWPAAAQMLGAMSKDSTIAAQIRTLDVLSTPLGDDDIQIDHVFTNPRKAPDGFVSWGRTRDPTSARIYPARTSNDLWVLAQRIQGDLDQGWMTEEMWLERLAHLMYHLTQATKGMRLQKQFIAFLGLSQEQNVHLHELLDAIVSRNGMMTPQALAERKDKMRDAAKSINCRGVWAVRPNVGYFSAGTQPDGTELLMEIRFDDEPTLFPWGGNVNMAIQLKTHDGRDVVCPIDSVLGESKSLGQELRQLHRTVGVWCIEGGDPISPVSFFLLLVKYTKQCFSDGATPEFVAHLRGVVRVLFEKMMIASGMPLLDALAHEVDGQFVRMEAECPGFLELLKKACGLAGVTEELINAMSPECLWVAIIGFFFDTEGVDTAQRSIYATELRQNDPVQLSEFFRGAKIQILSQTPRPTDSFTFEEITQPEYWFYDPSKDSLEGHQCPSFTLTLESKEQWMRGLGTCPCCRRPLEPEGFERMTLDKSEFEEPVLPDDIIGHQPPVTLADVQYKRQRAEAKLGAAHEKLQSYLSTGAQVGLLGIVQQMVDGLTFEEAFKTHGNDARRLRLQKGGAMDLWKFKCLGALEHYNGALRKIR